MKNSFLVLLASMVFMTGVKSAHAQELPLPPPVGPGASYPEPPSPPNPRDPNPPAPPPYPGQPPQPPPVPPPRYDEQLSYYDWAQATDGWGYCFQFIGNRVPMNDGRAQADYFCEQRFPSVYRLANAQDGRVYCFHFTPNGFVMNMGHPVNSRYCGY